MLKTWKSSYSNNRILETSDFLKTTAKELELLAKQALGEQLRSYKQVIFHHSLSFYLTLTRLKKIKRPNLAISSFKKGQNLKNEKKAK